MATATSSTASIEGEQRFVLRGVRWAQYVAMSEVLPDRPGLRMIYSEGSLTLTTKSHRHEWLAECFGLLVFAVASGCGLKCEAAGSTTFRREDRAAGAEGDKTFYFGDHAERVRGPRDIDLSDDPPPDLVIEVEVTNPADAAMETWAALGVPEVWRFVADRQALTTWLRREDGSYAQVDQSAAMPMLRSAEILDQLRLAEEMGQSAWFIRLADWVRAVVGPRGH